MFSLRSSDSLRPFRAAINALLDERDRWFLWTPALFGVGIALYFEARHEPSWVAALVAFVGVALVRAFPINSIVTAIVVNAMLIASGGFLAAKIRTEAVRAAVLAKTMRAARVTGHIERLERRADRSQRITLYVAAIESLPRHRTPQRVRIRLRQAVPDLKPGTVVRIRARLAPPPSPALPRGYDFARAAYFQGLGAVGYALAPPTLITPHQPPPWTLGLSIKLQQFRQLIGNRIETALPGEVGVMANALMTGERSGITQQTNDLYRDAGIFHILSISGLHMAIMGGSVFVLLRFLFAAIPFFALRYPIKKWAAVAGAAATFAYLLISGGAHPTVRSFIMIFIMFLAIVLDRPAIALRNVAIAALAILVITPESLFNAGFQLSFAAVAALVAAYEAHQHRIHTRRRLGLDQPAHRHGGPWSRGARTIWLFLVGIIATTLIAGLATAPFAAFHFHTSQQYSVITNMAAIPVSNLIVMPAALAAFVAMPFGLELWPLTVMAAGIEIMTWSAKQVTALPNATTAIPAFSQYALQLMIFGGLWLCIWRRAWRWLGLLVIVLGIYVATDRHPAAALIGKQGKLVALRDQTGALAAIPARQSKYVLSRWLEHDGDPRNVDAAWRGPGNRRPFRCDLDGCTGRIGRHLVALPRTAAALVDDCERADILVIPFAKPPGCATTARVIDVTALKRSGTHAIYLKSDGRLTIETVEQFRGHRPWTEAARQHDRATQRHERRRAARSPPNPANAK